MNRKIVSVILSSIVCASVAIACTVFIPNANANAEQSDNTIHIEEVKVTLDTEKYDVKTGELKTDYVLKLAEEIFAKKPEGCVYPSRKIMEPKEEYIKGQLSKDIRAMDYLARKYPEEFEPRTDLIYNDDELEVKYIAKILSVLENKSALTADQSKYLIGYLEGRKYQVRVAGYEGKYNSVVGGIMIDNAINKMPGMAESYAETVFGTELTAEQKALAEKLEAERLEKLEAEREAARLDRMQFVIKGMVITSRKAGEEDTSMLTTQEELDMYNQLIASGEIISREQWEKENKQ